MNFNFFKFQCFVLAISTTVVTSAPDFAVLQCRANCIEKLKTKETDRYKTVTCITKRCKECSRFCRVSVKHDGNCTSICSSENSQSICLSSCQFLKEKRKLGLKPGTCPETTTGRDLAPVTRCRTDNECPESEKCCPSKDARACQLTKFIFDSKYPPVPVDFEVITKTPSSVLLTWRMPLNRTWPGGIIFIIEKRHSVRLVRPSEADFSFWSFAGETSHLRTMVHKLNPGDWYQFRVAAHSKDGSNGFSEPSVSVKMSPKVQRPSWPRNFTTNGTWVEDGRVFVNLTWRKPLFTDLPVHRYRLVYLKAVGGSDRHYDAVQERRLRVDGKKTHAILTRLSPDSLYQIKIQAIVKLNRKRIRGRTKKIYIITPTLKKSNVLSTSDLSTMRRSATRPPRLAHTKHLVTMKSNVTFFCQSIIRKSDGYMWAILRLNVPGNAAAVIISYKPEKCKNGQHISAAKMQKFVKSIKKDIVLKHLYPSCSYTAKMTPYYLNKTADDEKSISFSTEIKSSEPTQVEKVEVPSSDVKLRVCYFSFLIAISNLVFLIL